MRKLRAENIRLTSLVDVNEGSVGVGVGGGGGGGKYGVGGKVTSTRQAFLAFRISH